MAHGVKPQAEDSTLWRINTVVGREISRTIFPKPEHLDVLVDELNHYLPGGL